MSAIACVSLLAHFPIRGEANNYGRGSGEILLDNIVCDGSETSLLECDHNPLMETNCAGDHSEDAAVACGGTYTCYGVYYYRLMLSLSL